MVKVPFRTRLTLIGLIVLAIGACSDCGKSKKPKPKPPVPPTGLICSDMPTITVQGNVFRDMNRNGRLDAYEDWRNSNDVRIQYLLDNMSVADKAGLMMHGTLPMTSAGRADLNTLQPFVEDSLINSYLSRVSGSPLAIATDHNKIQRMAAKIGWGIPVSISSEQRNHLTSQSTASTNKFSQWPGTLGLAAMGADGVKGRLSNRANDKSFVKDFADIARQEYRAVGIHISLSPQADIATEPRWGLIKDTFGEDFVAVSDFVGAYVEGLQHGTTGLTADSVAAVVKHFPGAGPQEGGLDGHNSFGTKQIYKNGNFGEHLEPFASAFNANASSVMPYYSIPVDANLHGTPLDEVAFGYNSYVLKNILRSQMHFDGLVLSDWDILADCEGVCLNGLTQQQIDNGISPLSFPYGMPWGVEGDTEKERVIKAVLAGVDQFGGHQDPSALIDAIDQGLIPMSRINESVKRILLQKLQLGLFESPCVDETKADASVGKPEYQNKADQAQRFSQVLLKNEGTIALPMGNLKNKRVYLHNVSPAAATKHGMIVVTDLNRADFAIVRVNTPYQTDPAYPFGDIHFGQLGFGDDGTIPLDVNKTGKYTGAADYAVIKQVNAAGVPMVLSIYLDRPAILTEVKDMADVILANFGSSDAAVLDVIKGTYKAKGRLPFDLPETWSFVTFNKEDVAFDASALYEYGDGIQL